MYNWQIVWRKKCAARSLYIRQNYAIWFVTRKQTLFRNAKEQIVNDISRKFRKCSVLYLEVGSLSIRLFIVKLKCLFMYTQKKWYWLTQLRYENCKNTAKMEITTEFFLKKRIKMRFMTKCDFWKKIGWNSFFLSNPYGKFHTKNTLKVVKLQPFFFCVYITAFFSVILHHKSLEILINRKHFRRICYCIEWNLQIETVIFVQSLFEFLEGNRL